MLLKDLLSPSILWVRERWPVVKSTRVYCRSTTTKMTIDFHGFRMRRVIRILFSQAGVCLVIPVIVHCLCRGMLPQNLDLSHLHWAKWTILSAPAKEMLPPVSKQKLHMVSPDCVKGAESTGLKDESSANHAGGVDKQPSISRTDFQEGRDCSRSPFHR